jgi:CRISPR/Cas system-associated protein Cas7 (RAMP superfamily)
MPEGKTLTHVAGELLIEARGAFLNGAGLGAGEDRTTTVPKTFQDGRRSVPYVSAQAWRRWLRNTLIEETGWDRSEIRAIAWNPKGNTSKAAGEANPVDFAEDDIFGYMRTAEGQGKLTASDSAPENSEDEAEGGEERVAAVMRSSPFASSILVSIRPDGWRGEDDGFVHVTSHDPKALEIEEWWRAIRLAEVPSKEQKQLKDKLRGLTLEEAVKQVREFAKSKKLTEPDPVPHPQSPLPYTTRFFNTHLEGVFCLNHARIGVFWNIGDRKELDPPRIKTWMQERKIELVEDRGSLGKIYRLVERKTARQRTTNLLKSLAVLRGGAKQAAFATDVAPKALIVSGLTCGNAVFNRLFRDTPEGPELDTKRLREIVKDYGARIVTPVYVGIRTGYLSNEEAVSQLETDRFVVCTPIEAAQRMTEQIP